MDDYKERFISINFSDETRRQIQFETSFGVKITIILYPSYDQTFWSFVNLSLLIPRHPDLKGNSCGLLGRWNDDPSDDFVDANGKTKLCIHCGRGNSQTVGRCPLRVQDQRSKSGKILKTSLYVGPITVTWISCTICKWIFRNTLSYGISQFAYFQYFLQYAPGSCCIKHFRPGSYSRASLLFWPARLRILLGKLKSFF